MDEWPMRISNDIAYRQFLSVTKAQQSNPDKNM